MKTILTTGLILALAATISSLVHQEQLPGWAERLGWTLVHSVWQLAAVALLALVANVALRRRTPNTRYGLSVVGMAFMLVIPCITWTMIEVRNAAVEQPAVTTQTPIAVTTWNPNDTAAVTIPSEEVHDRARTAESENRPLIVKSAAPIIVRPDTIQPVRPEKVSVRLHVALWLKQMQHSINPWLGWINCAWFAGVGLLAIRPVWGLWMQSRLRRVGLSNVSDELHQQLAGIAKQMGLSAAVSIAQSALVRVPMVVGYLRPMILLPASVLSGLTPTQLESLLAHELAHIRRHDWIVNAMQVVIETLLFYHPAVWWLSNQIRNERELCCDDLALAIVGDKAVYGRMLLVLEEMLHHSPSPALAATSGNLAQRVRRLLPGTPLPRRSLNNWLGGFVVLAVMGLAGGITILSAQQSPTRKQPPSVPVANDPNQKPPASQSSSPDKPSTKASASPQKAMLGLSTHDGPLEDPLIDIRLMKIAESGWYDRRSTRLHQDISIRNCGVGDLGYDPDAGWLAFRGARIAELDTENLDDAEKLPLKDVKSRLARQGRAVLPQAADSKKCLAIQTLEGHVAVMKLQHPFPWSNKLDVRRLTSDEDVPSDRWNDLESAAWGPVVDGFQSGIAYRTPVSRADGRAAIGQPVFVRLFVRNASKEVKTYSCQLSDHFEGEESAEESAEESKKLLPRFSRIDPWNPILVDAEGRRALIALDDDQHPHEGYQCTAELKPGEAMMIGAAGLVLLPSIGVEFHSKNRLTAVDVSLGDYRLSCVIDSGLVSSPQLPTGQLSLHVVELDATEEELLRQLDAVAGPKINVSDEKYPWKNGDSDVITALPKADGQFLTIPCLAVEMESKKPIQGAIARVAFSYDGDGWVWTIWEYGATTNADGRFEVRIPTKFLSGYRNDCLPRIDVEVKHPEYCYVSEFGGWKHLQAAGLVSSDGQVLKQATTPEPAQVTEDADTTKFCEFQLIGMTRAKHLSGRLLGTNGQPLTNIRIHFGADSGWPLWLGYPRTDAEGRFRVNVPEKSAVRLDFDSDDFGGRRFLATAEHTDMGDLRAGGAVKVRGRVLDAQAQPVAHVQVTTPSLTDPEGFENIVYYSDKDGWFETGALAPGQYEAEVGGIELPEIHGGSLIRKQNGRPPNLYVPQRFTVKEEGNGDLMLRPTKTATVTVRVITTVPIAGEGEFPQSLDPIRLRDLIQALHNFLNSAKQDADSRNEQEPKQSFPYFKVNRTTGQLSVVNFPEEMKTAETGMGILQSMKLENSVHPGVTVRGIIDQHAWSASSKDAGWLTKMLAASAGADMSESSNSDVEAGKAPPPNQSSVKIPRDLVDLVLEPHDFPQHLQVGSGPKLFGKSIRIPKLDADQLELKIYRYLPTTLRINLADASGKQVELKEEALPDGISINARYVREDAVRQAGAEFESSESLMAREVYDNSVLHYVIPGEPIEVTVKHGDLTDVQRFTLNDGETQTVLVKLADKVEWTESSKPTPKLEFPKP